MSETEEIEESKAPPPAFQAAPSKGGETIKSTAFDVASPPLEGGRGAVLSIEQQMKIWEADEYAGKSGSYISDPYTGKRTLKQEA